MAKSQVVRIDSFVSPAEDMTAAVQSFLSYCRAKNLSPNTLAYYNYRLKSFLQYLDEQKSDTAPSDITPQLIRAFVTSENTIHSASTANHSITALKAFFRYLALDGFIDTDPMASVQKIRQRREIIQTFSTDQIQAIFKTCQNDFQGIRDRAIIMTLFDCGLRASELCGLSTRDISWGEHTLLVLGKGDKQRVVPFGQATRQAIAQYASRRGQLETDALFVTCYGDPLNRFRLNEIIVRRCKSAGIDGVRCSPHTFRHTFAVSYLRAGGDVFSLQKILGHSDLTMTRRYAELSETDVQDKHRMFSPGDRLAPTTQKKGRTRLN